MEFNKKNLCLYAITDRRWTGKQTLYQQIESALKGGITCLQLREKNLSESEFLNEAVKIHELCRKYNVPLIINDNVEIALKSNAEGVHVGQGDMSVLDIRKAVGRKLIIGASAHNVYEAVEAEKNGADYLGAGAVFGTKTKNDANPLSKETLSEICTNVTIPVVAIGGINENNISELKNTGICGAALISAIFSADDIELQTKKLLRLSKDISIMG